ncbi:MAG: hydantoinase B/oxoprolinase family protein, partial [Chloroflexi bacterium]|nr:hydantoinase B/oxoprolinase family protein [Chloroflexota bacterium]
ASPVLVRRSSLRPGSGGDGAHPGGMGLRRDIEVLTNTEVTLLGERRRHRPWGLAGGGSGAPGDDQVLRAGSWEKVGAKATVMLEPGEVISLRSPGGGGWGRSPDEQSATAEDEHPQT